MKLQNKTKWKLEEWMCSTPEGVSETVPDDSFTIQELMARHVRGMRLDDDAIKASRWDDNPDLDGQDLESLSRMDLAERHEYAEHLKADIAKRKEAIKLAAAKLQVDTLDETAPVDKSKVKKSRGDARLGGNPPDDVPSRSEHAAGRSERSGRTEGDTPGISAGD